VLNVLRFLILPFALLSLISNGLFADESSSSNEFKDLCPTEKIVEVCDAATHNNFSVDINCSIDFTILDCKSLGFENNEITKKLLFSGEKASRVIADFNGALVNASVNSPNYQNKDIIEIKSLYTNSDAVSVPRNIVIRNARVLGSIRIFGMGENGENSRVQASSLLPFHQERLRAQAPSNISLQELSIVGQGRNLVYFGPGVHHSELIDSQLSGYSTRVGVYLDAESFGNSLLRNIFDVRTEDGSWLGFYDRGWPQVALDGSSENVVSYNRFENIRNGGVYLYRNCGEGGTVRYATPSRNQIVNNHFVLPDFYKTGTVSPAVFIGSRNYGLWENHMPGSHCNDDQKQGATSGSAVSNADFARFNRIISNTFYAKSNVANLDTRVGVGSIIKIGNPRLDKFNRLELNRWVER